MSVIRVNKNSDYTVMSNYHFKDKRLSLKAKGLLSQMLSLPDTWDYTIAGLAYINKEGELAIKSALDELKENGYLLVTKLMPKDTESGRIEYVYDIFEIPSSEIKAEPVRQEQPKKEVTEKQKVNTDDFETFWKAYPKKKAKGTAERAFEKAIKKTDLQTILTAIDVQKKSAQWKEKDGQFIPYPATWLNAECWNDEVESKETDNAQAELDKAWSRLNRSKKAKLEELAKKMGVDT